MPVSLPPIDYAQLFQTLPGLYVLFAPDGTVLDVSDAHVASTGVARAQAQGRPVLEAYPSLEESQRTLVESLARVRETRAPDAMPLLRYDLDRPDGQGRDERYWQVRHFPLLDAQGQLQYILQIPQDLTEQVLAARQAQAAELALSEEQDRTRFILENLPVMVWTNLPDGTPDYYNARWQAFTGQHPQAGIDWQASHMVHPEDEARIGAEMGAAFRKGEEFQLEFRLRRHDGQYRWLLARNVPRRDAQGRLLMWVGAGLDVHDQKAMVAELLATTEAQAALAEQSLLNYQLAQHQRQLYTNLLEHAPAQITIIRGPEHRYEFANAEYRRLVGGQDVVGRTVAEVFPEVVAQGLIAQLDEVYRTGQPFHGEAMTVELENPHRTAYYNLSYQRFQENGRPAGITVYAYDVTELALARQALAS